MVKTSVEITGLDELEKDLDRMIQAVESSSSEAEGQLSINLKLIFSNLSFVNSNFESNFSDTTNEQEIIEFFAEKYQEIMAQGFFDENYNPKKTFNDIYNPYAKVE